MAVQDQLLLAGKVLTVALAVGLDVLAVSIGVGVARLDAYANRRIGIAFSLAEILMQLLGYMLGSGAGGIVGVAAAYGGFGLLGLVGAMMVRKSFAAEAGFEFDPASGAGLLLMALSISLDSLGVGVALPAAAIPLIPLLLTLAVTTAFFTFLGISFGAFLGERVERNAERLAGITLMVLAFGFTLERLF